MPDLSREEVENRIGYLTRKGWSGFEQVPSIETELRALRSWLTLEARVRELEGRTGVPGDIEFGLSLEGTILEEETRG